MNIRDIEKGKSYALLDGFGRELVIVDPHQFDPENAWELWIMDPFESWVGFDPFYDLEELIAALKDFVENDHPHPGCRVVAMEDNMDWEEVTIRITG